MLKFSELSGDPNQPMYCFIPEVIQLRGLEQPVKLGEHAMLRRLQSPQKEQLRALLDPYIQVQRLGGITPWEFNPVQVAPGQVQFVPHPDPNENNFWVVEYWRQVFDLELELALELADPGLTPLLSVIRFTGQGINAINKHAIINWLDINFKADPVVLGPNEVAGIIEVMDLLIAFTKNTDQKLSHIHKALQDFVGVKDVSRRNPLYVIGLVSIIESLLLTNHNQKAQTSLTHQFKEKLVLMNNRFAQPMDLNKYFPNAAKMPFKKIVEKLYSYRSEVAHGSNMTPSTSLAQLGGHDAVCKFLHELVRRLLIQAVREPELITDLKSC